MKTSINIKNKIAAIKELECYKRRKVVPVDVRLTNTHLKKINGYIHLDLFSKNDLFVSSDTLYDIMQPIGGKGRHNYHALTPKELVEVFNSLIDPYCIYVAKYGRLGIVTETTTETGDPLLAVIEIGAGLMNNLDANINKLITTHPTFKDVKRLKNRQILYSKDGLNNKK